MRKFSRIITLGSYVALTCSGMLMSTGCETAGDKEHVEAPPPVSIEIRYQDDNVARQQPNSGVLSL